MTYHKDIFLSDSWLAFQLIIKHKSSEY